MKFYGISKRFSFVGNKQYEDIVKYWDYFSLIYGIENIKGLGLNWDSESLEYIIGNIDEKLDFDLNKIKSIYSDCIYKEVDLPDDDWKSYFGKTNDLANMYDEIYKDGSLVYEIEVFKENGDCEIIIYR